MGAPTPPPPAIMSLYAASKSNSEVADTFKWAGVRSTGNLAGDINGILNWDCRKGLKGHKKTKADCDLE